MDSVKGLVVDLDVRVEMRDGVLLSTDLYRPAEGVWPALLLRTPYSKMQPPTMMASLDPIRAVREGFAVVIQDTRGRFDSEGEFSPFDEGEDGFDCVGWVAAQPWCDGNVGMFGS